MTVPSPPERPREDPEPPREDGARLGDEADFEPFRQGLRSFLKSRLGDDSDIDDCLQTVSLKWLEHREAIPESATRAWLFTVAANEARQLWRKRSRNRRAVECLGEQVVRERLADDPIVRRETQEAVSRAIGRLPDPLRQVVQMRLETDATFEQIAEQLQIPLGTTLSRMHRALARLENELKPLQ